MISRYKPLWDSASSDTPTCDVRRGRLPKQLPTASHTHNWWNNMGPLSPRLLPSLMAPMISVSPCWRSLASPRSSSLFWGVSTPVRFSVKKAKIWSFSCRFFSISMSLQASVSARPENHRLSRKPSNRACNDRNGRQRALAYFHSQTQIIIWMHYCVDIKQTQSSYPTIGIGTAVNKLNVSKIGRVKIQIQPNY